MALQEPYVGRDPVAVLFRTVLNNLIIILIGVITGHVFIIILMFTGL
jgi:hypothetical protein